MPEITNSIRRLRFDHGEMTQQELAERVGVTRQTIIALRPSRRKPLSGFLCQLHRRSETRTWKNARN